MPIQSWPQHPMESIAEKDEQAMLGRLLNFLKQESDRPEKQDVAIFIPVETTPKRYIGRLN